MQCATFQGISAAFFKIPFKRFECWGMGGWEVVPFNLRRRCRRSLPSTAYTPSSLQVPHSAPLPWAPRHSAQRAPPFDFSKYCTSGSLAPLPGGISREMQKRAAGAEPGDGTKRPRRLLSKLPGSDPYAACSPSMKHYSMREAPTFRPTVDEWADPAVYISGIRHQFEQFGICKIVPPAGWRPPSDIHERRRSDVLYPTRRQAVHEVTRGRPFPDGKDYTFAQYERMALMHKRALFPEFITAEDPPVRPAAAPVVLAPCPAVGVKGSPLRIISAPISTLPSTPTSAPPVALPLADGPEPATSTAAACSVSSSPGLPEEGIPPSPFLAPAHVVSPPPTARVPADGTPSALSATTPAAASPGAKMAAAVEARYWAHVEAGGPALVVEYANDQDTRRVGSGFASRFKVTDTGTESPAASVASRHAPGEEGTDSGRREHAGDTSSGVSRAQSSRLADGFDPEACFPSNVPARFDDPTYYRDCGWNLNNLPFVAPSVRE